MKYKLSLFIFTRDLRYDDNTALIMASKNSKQVIPIFIFTPDQITNNNYKSNNAIQFMCESIEELNISTFYGKNTDIIMYLIKKFIFGAIYITKDYSPFAINREKEIKKICDDNNIDFICPEDHMLISINAILKNDGNHYSKFTPYYDKWMEYKKKKPEYYKCENLLHLKNKEKIKYEENKNVLVKGGRKNGIKRLYELKNFDYSKRDYPIYSTSLLSAYIRFGCVSVREVYYTIKKDDFRRQLCWRDFYMNLLYSRPEHLNKNYDKKIKWNSNELLNKWKLGKTGIPFVDAGMRQMNKTGWMHNRLRLITSNYLIRIMKIDWREGEKYFAKKLIDYDISNNNGNWLWSLNYRYTFNPFLQSYKFDKECIYIKRWVEELRDIPNKDIHLWNKNYKKYKIKYEPLII